MSHFFTPYYIIMSQSTGDRVKTSINKGIRVSKYKHTKAGLGKQVALDTWLYQRSAFKDVVERYS